MLYLIPSLTLFSTDRVAVLNFLLQMPLGNFFSRNLVYTLSRHFWDTQYKNNFDVFPFLDFGPCGITVK